MLAHSIAASSGGHKASLVTSGGVLYTDDRHACNHGAFETEVMHNISLPRKSLYTDSSDEQTTHGTAIVAVVDWLESCRPPTPCKLFNMEKFSSTSMKVC
jgi:hypothetical protein